MAGKYLKAQTNKHKSPPLESGVNTNETNETLILVQFRMSFRNLFTTYTTNSYSFSVMESHLHKIASNESPLPSRKAQGDLAGHSSLNVNLVWESSKRRSKDVNLLPP